MTGISSIVEILNKDILPILNEKYTKRTRFETIHWYRMRNPNRDTITRILMDSIKDIDERNDEFIIFKNNKFMTIDEWSDNNTNFIKYKDKIAFDQMFVMIHELTWLRHPVNSLRYNNDVAELENKYKVLLPVGSYGVHGSATKHALDSLFMVLNDHNNKDIFKEYLINVIKIM